MAGAERDDSDKGAMRGRERTGNEGDRAGRKWEKERECNEAESRTPTESAEHRMAEGMVGWIQLLGEQYCLAVIVCSSTCSGFPGLGPLASNPMSRYTTIFCLLAITPSARTRRRRKKKRRTTRTRMSIARTATLASPTLASTIVASGFRFVPIKRRMHRTGYVRVFSDFSLQHCARATNWTVLPPHVQHAEIFGGDGETWLPAPILFPRVRAPLPGAK